MKKLLLFVVTMLLSAASHAATFESDGLRFTITSEEDQTVELTIVIDRPTGDFTIPSYAFDGETRYTVTSMHWNAFYSCNDMTSVTIPSTLTSVGASAPFTGCNSLSAITVEEENPMYSSSTGILLNKEKTSLLRFPPAKKDCVIPSTVTKIFTYSFAECTELTSIVIPSSVAEIEDDAFWSCSNIKEFIVEEENRNFSSDDGILFNKDKTALLRCPESRTECTIPSSVTKIGNFSFSRCVYLTEISIPESVTEIGEWAFYYCDRLTSISIPDSVTSIGWNSFGLSSSLTSVTLPASLTLLEAQLFSACMNLTSIVIPEAVTKIEYGVFFACQNLTSVIIPENVAEIEEEAFAYCTALKTIYNLNPEPQAVTADTFNGVPADATVFVPKGSVTAYSEAEGWNYFTDFREIGTFSISLSHQTLTLNSGETAELTASIDKDGDVTIVSEEWSSSDPSVATVANGVITAVADGKAIIYLTVSDSNGIFHRVSCVVTVGAPTDRIDGISTDTDAAADVFTLQGLPVLRGATTAEVNALPSGIYILRQGKSSRKIAIK